MPISSLYHKLSFLVAVERPGVNRNDIHCNMNDDVSSYVSKIDYMFNEPLDKNVPTIGVEDDGNEIGMGNIYESIIHILPTGGIIASKIRATSLVVSAVSNWGVYGIVAALSTLTGSQLMHEASLEQHLIEIYIKLGAVDGISNKSSYSADGLPSNIHGFIVDILNYLVLQGISQN